MDKLFIIILNIFDLFKDTLTTCRNTLEIWLDKRLSIKEKIIDTFVEFVIFTLGVILTIKIWSTFT